MKHCKIMITIMLAIFLLCMAGACAGDVDDVILDNQDPTATEVTKKVKITVK